MKSLNFLLNGLLSILDVKQYIFFGSENSNSLTENEVKFHRRSFDTFDNFQPVKTFLNPLLMLNTPDPGVTKLADGTGWVAVATSNHASSHGNTSAFPMYFSPGNVNSFYIVLSGVLIQTWLSGIFVPGFLHLPTGQGGLRTGPGLQKSTLSMGGTLSTSQGGCLMADCLAGQLLLYLVIHSGHTKILASLWLRPLKAWAGQ